VQFPEQVITGNYPSRNRQVFAEHRIQQLMRRKSATDRPAYSPPNPDLALIVTNTLCWSLTQTKRSHSPPDRSTGDSAARPKLGREIALCIKRALDEDLGAGDVTTNNIVREGAHATARIVSKQDGVASGLDVVQAVFLELDESVEFIWIVSDAARVVSGQVVLELAGPARAVFSGERTALNFLGRMSGIASLTRQFVDAIAGTKAVILDTRKTAPGLRAIEKLAVRHGGGDNHRFGLYDMVLIKDNHIDYAGSLSEAIRRIRASGSSLDIEVEARTIDEVHEALDLGVKRILLDNMSIAELQEAVAASAGRAKLEASGNVTLDNVREIAETDVDFISVGALTHSAKAFDVSLRFLG
jgi:nicotinate-nucleotide pyrophosphorylase (carboxylating)